MIDIVGVVTNRHEVVGLVTRPWTGTIPTRATTPMSTPSTTASTTTTPSPQVLTTTSDSVSLDTTSNDVNMTETYEVCFICFVLYSIKDKQIFDL